jgi:hypothetical protein
LSRQIHEWAINAEQVLCSAKACGRPLDQAYGSQNMAGGRFCATSLQPRIHRIIGRSFDRMAAVCANVARPTSQHQFRAQSMAGGTLPSADWSTL